MSKARYLSKSRFKIGCECPTKLFFTGKKEFGNNNLDNPFLKALAEGGFQVGELAKIYHEGGIEVESLDVQSAIHDTAELLKQENVVLYEPAIQFGDLLVRVDILVKNGDKIEIIEVKAKSFDPKDENPFYNKTLLKKGMYQLNSEWAPYLLDVAFQKYVVQKAHPNWSITSFLMLADKSAKASVDGINQRFFISKSGAGQTEISSARGTIRQDLGDQLLVKVAIDGEVAVAHNAHYEGRTFEEHVLLLADLYKNDKMAEPSVGSKCKGCEFRISSKEKAGGLKSGFDTCWQQAAKVKVSDLSQPFVFDIWNFRGAQDLIDSGQVFLDQVTEADIEPIRRKDGEGLSSSERQWLQIKKAIEKDTAPYFDVHGMKRESAGWHYPLNFIDFETTMAALPFHNGRRPYEQIAFQFSHHVVTERGQIEHCSEYINRERGKFPNFDFVRHLRKALSQNEGTIFRFAAHENTVLCQIHGQLRYSEESDRDELMAWIETITKSTGSAECSWEGARNMVDMCDLVKKYFYHPLTGGSNSIKKVLPAVLQESALLQNTYSNPIYGAAGGIVSKNYRNWQWIKKDESGKMLDPYKLLPPVFEDLNLEEMDALITEGSIADGGAAMTAYARMQFSQMGTAECEAVCKALLKYCELDTFAMVLIYEYWMDCLITGKSAVKTAPRKRAGPRRPKASPIGQAAGKRKKISA